MIIDWSSLARRFLLVTLAGVALAALTSCGGGGDGGGGPGVMITPPPTTSPPTTPPPGARGVLVSGTSGCSTPVHMRFFQYRTRSVSSLAGQWPGGNNVYVISPGGTHQRTLACRPGYMVCYGGRNPANNRFWGAGIDGREVCTNCCTTCPSSGSRNLSFGSLQCTGGGGGGGGGGTQPIRDVNVTIPSSCSREVEVCVRDNECEDGDQVRVSVNSSVVFSGEIVNEWQCRTVPVRTGSNSIEFFAINGTGFKGNCSYRDENTGELRVRGGSSSRNQSWTHLGGTGSSARLNVTVGPPGGSCTPGGTTPPPPTRRLYGAIAFSYNGSTCEGGHSAGISGSYSSKSAAESNALSGCRQRNGRSCRIVATFGSAYAGNNQCGAIAYGERSGGCTRAVGTGSTLSSAISDTLTSCRSGGYSCSIIPRDTRGQLALCSE